VAGPGFRIAAAFKFAEERGLAADAEAIRRMPIDASIARGSAVRKGALVKLLEERGLMSEFVDLHWPNRNTPAGERRRAVFLQRLRLNERRLSGEDPAPDDPFTDNEEPEAEEDRTLFALEAHLRDFIASNLSRVPMGGTKLMLYKDANGRSGVEYPTGVGPIDILAVDSDGNFFVFELKVDRGPDRALGQLARYMGWVKIELARGRAVTGVVVASSIDPKLRYAAAVMPTALLLEYELDFKIRGVAPMGHIPEPLVGLP
jgi:hypothetical protein